MLQNQELDDLESYLSRGRQLADAPTEELESRWTAQMREWVKNFTGFDHRERDDIQAELQLRGIEPPIRLVEDVMRSLRQLGQKAADDVKNFDPDRGTAIEECLRNKIARLRKKH